MSQDHVATVRRWAPVIEAADPAGYAEMIDAIFAGVGLPAAVRSRRGHLLALVQMGPVRRG